MAKEINGYTVADKKQVANFLGLKDDGSTACGCWIYSGYYPGPDKKDNKAAARDKKDPTGLGLYPGWAFAWPVNRRIIYNRCSLDPQGQPWNKDKALVRLGPGGQDLEELRRARLQVDRPRHQGPRGARRNRPRPPFSCCPKARAGSSCPAGLCKEGPFPEHYEALECPLREPHVGRSSPTR